MKKTNNFFVIHNFNTIPTDLLSYCENYIIYDCSNDANIVSKLDSMNLNLIHIPNTGHNITSYFSYFDSNYSSLPEVLCITKGNMLGRHCSKEYFDKVYDNTFFTYLYENKEDAPRYSKSFSDSSNKSISFLATESQYLENNNSWYVESPNHPHKYFDNFDDLLTFIYKKPVIPRYTLFSPGACYILRREQVTKNTPVFYRNINKLMNYGLNPSFPSEAHQIERMLPIIFESSYEVNEWMNSETLFGEKLQERLDYMAKKEAWKSKRFKKLRLILGETPDYLR